MTIDNQAACIVEVLSGSSLVAEMQQLVGVCDTTSTSSTSSTTTTTTSESLSCKEQRLSQLASMIDIFNECTQSPPPLRSTTMFDARPFAITASNATAWGERKWSFNESESFVSGKELRAPEPWSKLSPSVAAIFREHGSGSGGGGGDAAAAFDGGDLLTSSERELEAQLRRVMATWKPAHQSSTLYQLDHAMLGFAGSALYADAEFVIDGIRFPVHLALFEVRHASGGGGGGGEFGAWLQQMREAHRLGTRRSRAECTFSFPNSEVYGLRPEGVARYLRCVYSELSYVHERAVNEAVLPVAIYMHDHEVATECVRWALTGTEGCAALFGLLRRGTQLQYAPLRTRAAVQISRGLRSFSTIELEHELASLETNELLELIEHLAAAGPTLPPRPTSVRRPPPPPQQQPLYHPFMPTVPMPRPYNPARDSDDEWEEPDEWD